jgi:endogenous inhibitor of DNA gyrase (YacG/DUF329 family)
MTDEPTRSPCPECGKNVTWTQAGKPRQHKCEPKAKPAAAPPKKYKCPECGEEATAEYFVGGQCAACEAEVTPVEVKVQITPDRVIAAFIKTRDKIAELNKEIKRLNALQDAKREWLANDMTKQNETGKRTVSGSCGFYNFTSVTVADGDTFKDWVHEDWENRKYFLTNAASKDQVTLAVEDGDTPPPGVNYTVIRKVRVNSP